MKKMKRKIEVLAPAGSREALEAAVFSGADAVYLAGKAFGARAAAQNFEDDELRAAAEFCHARGVKLYITVNTLIKNAEIADVIAFIGYLCKIAVDAVIVQDIGLLRLIRQCAPTLPVHASTQMSLHSRAGVQFLKEQGAKRVVLARELSLKEMAEITDTCDIETECFVHGALCVSVSGQCYFSAMLGGRSGNRGMCAQTCRLPFLADGGNGHALSLKDLSYIDEIQSLAGQGVTSAKIEGRMKRPEYVAAAVSACRKGADGEEIPEKLRTSLTSVFSRSGFTKGYLNEKIDEKMLGIRTKQDVTAATEKVFGSLKELYRKERQSVEVTFTLSVTENSVTLTVCDKDKNYAKQAVPCEESINLAQERCVQQLKKTGGTPFYAQDIVVPENGVPISISTLNKLRRELLITLLKVRGEVKEHEFLCKYEPNKNTVKAVRKEPMRWIASYRFLEQITEEAQQMDKIILPLFADFEKINKLPIEPEKIIVEIPRVIFGLQSEQKVRGAMQKHMEQGRTAFLCGNLGAVQLCRELGAKAHGGFSLNVMNSEALNFLAECGLQSAELSPELTIKEIGGMQAEIPTAVMVYGRQAVMLTRKCPVKSAAHLCKDCKGRTALTDRKQIGFPVMCTLAGMNKYTEVFNSVPLWMMDKAAEIPQAAYGILRFTVENAVECAQVLAAVKRPEKPAFAYTRGLFNRGIN